MSFSDVCACVSAYHRRLRDLQEISAREIMWMVSAFSGTKVSMEDVIGPNPFEKRRKLKENEKQSNEDKFLDPGDDWLEANLKRIEEEEKRLEQEEIERILLDYNKPEPEPSDIMSDLEKEEIYARS